MMGCKYKKHRRGRRWEEGVSFLFTKSKILHGRHGVRRIKRDLYDKKDFVKRGEGRLWRILFKVVYNKWVSRHSFDQILFWGN